MILFYKTRTHEENVSNANIAALGLWTEIKALGGCTCLKFLECDVVSCVGVVGFAMGFSVVVVVQKKSTTGNSMKGQIVNTTAVVCGVTYEVGAFGLYELALRRLDALRTYPIVEALAFKMADLINPLSPEISIVILIAVCYDLHVEIHPTVFHSACSSYKYHHTQFPQSAV